MQIFTNWNHLKQFVGDESLKLFYQECSRKYFIYTIFEQNQFCVEIWKDGSCAGVEMTENDTWKLDFENNYKSEAREL